MATRSPPAVELINYVDQPRTHNNVCEPFMVTHRMLREGNIKIIWWYIAAIDEETEQVDGESHFKARWFAFDDALGALTFEADREVVRKAIEIFKTTFDIKHNVEQGLPRMA